MGGVKKEYRILPGTDGTVLNRTVSAFAAQPCISRIIITVPDKPHIGEAAARQALAPGLFAGEQPHISFVSGGSTRRASVLNALLALAAYKPSYVLIHDGCRPWVSGRLIQEIIDAVQEHGAVIPMLPLIDTPKEINHPFNQGPGLPVITRDLCRSLTGLAQTPQAFEYAGILAAHETAQREDTGLCIYTDDAQVWGEFCGPVAVVPGEAENRKITFPGDLEAMRC